MYNTTLAFAYCSSIVSVSERRGHRKFRLTSRKNYERKKAAKKKAPPQQNKMEEHQCAEAVTTLPFSLPLSLYTDQALPTLSVLSRRLFRIESINEGTFVMFVLLLVYIVCRVDQCS